MKVISASHEILYMPDPAEILRGIEVAGRTCYKSEDKITPDSAAGFVRRIIKSGHHSALEHMGITVRFTCDRGVSHEIVRHRIAAYSQESTRFVNFKEGITVVNPCFLPGIPCGEYRIEPYSMRSIRFGDDDIPVLSRAWGVKTGEPERMPEYRLFVGGNEYQWLEACLFAEQRYCDMIGYGSKPEEARSVLPNSLKTELVMTANLREWKHVLNLRCSRAAHPQIREIMLPLLEELYEKITAVFDDEYEKYVVANEHN